MDLPRNGQRLFRIVCPRKVSDTLLFGSRRLDHAGRLCQILPIPCIHNENRMQTFFRWLTALMFGTCKGLIVVMVVALECLTLPDILVAPVAIGVGTFLGYLLTPKGV